MKSANRILTVASLAMLLGIARPTTVNAQDSFGQQADSLINRLFRRWVGTQMNGLPLFVDFFGDSMVVINNGLAADFAATPFFVTVYGRPRLDSVLANAFRVPFPDTLGYFPDGFRMRYRFRLERMLLEVGEQAITMSAQDFLARPLEARWFADLPDGTTMELRISTTGVVSRRTTPGGSWVAGEWDRTFRDMMFDWNPDSLETPDSTMIWNGIYDADGQQIILENVGEGTSVTIFRRIIR